MLGPSKHCKVARTFVSFRRRSCEGVAGENSCIKRQNSAVASAKVVQARQLASITGTLLSMSQGKAHVSVDDTSDVCID